MLTHGGFPSLVSREDRRRGGGGPVAVQGSERWSLSGRWEAQGRRGGKRGDERRACGDGRKGSGDEGDAGEENGTYIEVAMEAARGKADANGVEGRETVAMGEQAEVADKEVDGAEMRVREDPAGDSVYLDGDGGEGVIGVEAGDDIGAATTGRERGGEGTVGFVALDRTNHEGQRLGREGTDRERRQELDKLDRDRRGCRRLHWRARELEGFAGRSREVGA